MLHTRTMQQTFIFLLQVIVVGSLQIQQFTTLYSDSMLYIHKEKS